MSLNKKKFGKFTLLPHETYEQLIGYGGSSKPNEDLRNDSKSGEQLTEKTKKTIDVEDSDARLPPPPGEPVLDDKEDDIHDWLDVWVTL